MPDNSCSDPVANNLWHPIVAVEEMQHGKVSKTRLLGQTVAFTLSGNGQPQAWLHLPGCSPEESGGDGLPLLERYGYAWICLGTPDSDLFSIPEYAEAGRRNIHAASIGVQVSAPRAIENFLDMGHFPFVHTDILGVEPHTEVKEYQLAVSDDDNEILATQCHFFQPMAAAGSSGGADVEYIYRVPHPFCSVLYKSSAADADKMDVIALFVQPVSEESVRAHMMLSILDDQNEDKAIRLFQQTIFGQDKPILENQFPKRLPLDPRAETPIRADKSAIAYRRWLSQKGLRYGVIAANTAQ